MLDFAGEHHRVDRAGLLPRPGRDIPIWFGGFSPPAFRRAARIGDGFQFGAATGAIRRQWELVKQWLAENGRSAEGFGAEATVDFSLGPDSWRKCGDAWREAGGTHYSLRAMDTAVELSGGTRVGYQTPGDFIDALEQFAKAMS